MFIKAFFFIVLSVLALAKPQTDKETEEALKNLNVNEIPNRIEFISNFHHSPESNVKEGDIITINYEPPTPENAALASGLVNYFTIAIGTGNGFMVDDTFFMESERLPIPTSPMSYQFQLPAQMENKKYCIVYTPYTDQTATQKPMVGDQIMESLYETWFPIAGSLAVGSGPVTVENTIANNVSVSQNGNAGSVGNFADNTNAQVQNGATETNGNAVEQTNEKSSSITISPAITAFIAVLFACFFI
ncbi:hypothetical protein BCR36DRAFT_582402 [Piromyces finnis]|uniref:Uncharacterized protein n=1 Tax=Piromyces finnis TaxID=1754191 RepID=A0A1Y1VD22_9FUNG|nr:hypothetical protein BCR36DRAFT_582402 [Piromyces finnis]|eukprot:ORX52999.1 hypothetical protein BCR36DRAFT_582402 [Piromyces finnis]